MYGINIVNKLIESNYMQEIEAKVDLVHKMHGDYGHFDSIHIKFKYINQYINKHGCNEHIPWTLGLGILENNWSTMLLSTYYQIFIFERDYEAMKV